MTRPLSCAPVRKTPRRNWERRQNLCIGFLDQGGPQLAIVGRGAEQRLLRAWSERNRIINHHLQVGDNVTEIKQQALRYSALVLVSPWRGG